jgi:hypothetical protein
MTQDEKIARTRQLLSAPPRQDIKTPELEPPKRIQPEPNEIGYT